MTVIKKDIKAILTKTEEMRHQKAAEFFLMGAESFLIEQEYQIKKYVNADLVRKGIVNQCKERVDALKKSLEQKAEDVRQNATSKFDKLVSKMLLISLLGAVTLNKIVPNLKEIYEKYNNFIDSNILKEFEELKIKSFGIIDIARNDANNYIRFFAKLILEHFDTFFNGIEGNIFVDMLNAGAQFAGKRARGAMWLMLKVFSMFVENDVRKRPVLDEFLKFGPKVFNEISEIENDFRDMTDQVASGESMKKVEYHTRTRMRMYGMHYVESWTNELKLSANESKIVKRKLRELDEKILDISKNLANSINVDSVFSQMNAGILTARKDTSKAIAPQAIYNVSYYQEANEYLDEIIKQPFDAEGWFTGDITLKNLRFEKEPKVLTDSMKRVQKYLDENSHRNDESFNMIKKEFDKLKGKSDIEKFYLIRWILYAALMDQKKQQMQKITFAAISQQNYSSNTILNKLSRKLQNINDASQSQFDVIMEDFKKGRITTKGFSDKVDLILNEFNSTPVIFSMFNNTRIARYIFSPHKVINQVQLLKNAIRKAEYVQKGLDGDRIYDIHQHGVASHSSSDFDQDGKMYNHIQDEKQKNDGIIPMAEVQEILLEECVKLRLNINKARRRRAELIQIFNDVINELTMIRPKIYGIKDVK